MVKEIGYFIHGVVSYVFDDFFEFFCVSSGELSGMAIDGADELGGGLSKEGVHFF